MPDWTPEALMNSPEKADLVRAIEDARIDSDLSRLGLHLADGTLAGADVGHALRCYELRKLWLDGRFVPLDDGRRRAYRDVAREWIAGHGGTFPDPGGGVWKADGGRLWKAIA